MGKYDMPRKHDWQARLERRAMRLGWKIQPDVMQEIVDRQTLIASESKDEIQSVRSFNAIMDAIKIQQKDDHHDEGQTHHVMITPEAVATAKELMQSEDYVEFAREKQRERHINARTVGRKRLVDVVRSMGTGRPSNGSG